MVSKKSKEAGTSKGEGFGEGGLVKSPLPLEDKVKLDDPYPLY